MRILLRHQIAAIIASIPFLTLIMGPTNLWSFGIVLVICAWWFFVLMRFGMMAVMIQVFTLFIFIRFPMTLNASAWCSGYSYAALAIFLAIVLYAFRYSLGGQPLLAPSRLDD
jgi:hypothetical protein